MSAASHGIGAPGTAVLVEEMIKLGARNMIRIGNSGGLDPALEIGDLAISTGCVRDDGTSRTYVIPEYPAVADFEIVGALVGAAKRTGVRAKAGVTWSLDAFYARNAVAGPKDTMLSMSVDGYWPSPLEARIRDMQQARILNCEMEAGVLLTLAGLFGIRAGRDLRRVGPCALAGAFGTRSRSQHGELHRRGDPSDARDRGHRELIRHHAAQPERHRHLGRAAAPLETLPRPTPMRRPRARPHREPDCAESA